MEGTPGPCSISERGKIMFPEGQEIDGGFQQTELLRNLALTVHQIGKILNSANAASKVLVHCQFYIIYGASFVAVSKDEF